MAASARGDVHENAIAVIDTAQGRVVRRLESGPDPEQLAVSPDGRTLWVSNEDTAAASAVDVARGRIRARAPVGEEPAELTELNLRHAGISTVLWAT